MANPSQPQAHTNIFRNMWSCLSKWISSRKLEKQIKSKKQMNNFVIATAMENASATNHIVVFENAVYRVLIDSSSINVIDLNGKPISDSDLIVQLLKGINHAES